MEAKISTMIEVAEALGVLPSEVSEITLQAEGAVEDRKR
jgi:hypothetical protein